MRGKRKKLMAVADFSGIAVSEKDSARRTIARMLPFPISDFIFLISSSALFLASLAWLADHGPLGNGGSAFIAAYALAFLGMLGIWRSLPERDTAALWLLVPLALVARLLLLSFPANDDVFRFLWEGHVQSLGYNPFVLAPDSPVLAPFRTEYWHRINHPEFSTIYLPFMQWVFRAVAAAHESVFAIKITAVAFDLGTFAMLALLAHRRDTRARHLVLYALNPLVLLFIAGEGHMDSLLLFWLTAAAAAWAWDRRTPAFLALGFALMTSFKAALFPLFFVRRSTLKYLPLLAVPALLLGLPYWAGGETAAHLFGVPLRFATEFRFNGPVYTLLSLATPEAWAFAIPWFCGGLFLTATGLVLLATPDPVRALFLAAAALTVCLPTLHPWYLLLVTPWLVLYRAPVWLAFHLSIAAVFPVYAVYWATGDWSLPLVALFLELMPLVAVYFLCIRGSRGALRTRTFAPPQRLSVIIPVLNEADNLRDCLTSLRQPGFPPKTGAEMLAEVFVVDGGSTDKTREIAREILGAEGLLESPPGRGIQSARGVEASTGDIVLILHADSRLLTGALERMWTLLRERPDAAGGAFGAGFDHPHPKFRLIEILNNFRAGSLGIAFGDQAQFFRRAALVGKTGKPGEEERGFPALRLMEDIELSMRLKETGAVLFVPDGVTNSARRWIGRAHGGYALNSIRVIVLSALYLFRRRLGFRRGDGSGYYRAYYGNGGGTAQPAAQSAE